MKEVFNKYINNKTKLEKYQQIGIIALIIVFAGTFGWIYEFIFYYFNGGCKEWYLQGGNFLPWINIYASGSLIVLLLTRKLKKHPILIFLIATLSTGIFEYFSGLLIYQFKDGLRLWDYNQEILNFGNIGGFVCLRSVLVFGISSLLLMYIVVPLFIYISQKMTKKTFLIISISLLSIILIDEFYNLVIARTFNLLRATQIYQKVGFKYVKFK